MKNFIQTAHFARNFFVVAAILLLSGCASITKGTNDTLQVEIANCGESVSCEASNKKGKWPFKAPGSVTFKKSDNALDITCQDGPETLTHSLTPKRARMAIVYYVFGIGGLIDIVTDAHWDIVDSVSLHREYCHNSKTATAE